MADDKHDISHADIYRELGTINQTLGEAVRQAQRDQSEVMSRLKTHGTEIRNLQVADLQNSWLLRGIALTLAGFWALIVFFREPVIHWLGLVP